MCVIVPNFIKIGQTVAEMWLHGDVLLRKSAFLIFAVLVV